MANGFQNFTNRLFDPGVISQENVQRNQAMADALMAQSSSAAPIAHPLQGVAQLVQALNAQAFRQRANRGQEALKAQQNQQLGQFLSALEDPSQGDPLSLALQGAQDNPVLASVAGPLLTDRQRIANREDVQTFQADQADAARTARSEEARLDREFRQQLEDAKAQERELAQIRDIQSRFTLQANDQEFQRELKDLARQSAGLDLSERQGKAAAWAMSFAQGMDFMDQQLTGSGDFEGKGQYTPNLKDAALFAKSIDEKTGAISRELLSRGLSDEAIAYFQSAYMMIDPIVRQRTGAAVREFEFITQVRNLIPLSNDTQQSLKQKQLARQTAMQSLLLESGPAAGFIVGGSPQQQSVLTIDTQGNQL